MDRWTRHERLYRHLLSLGLVVIPMFADGDETRIDHLLVSVDLELAPAQPALEGVAEEAAQTGIDAPMEGAKIRPAIRPEQSTGLNVVDFPPKL